MENQSCSVTKSCVCDLCHNTSYLHEQTEDESTCSIACGVLDVVVFVVGGEAITPPTRCSGRGKVKNTQSVNLNAITL